MTKAINIKAIEKATQKPWDEWLEFFESIDAKNLSHKEIAQKVYKLMEEFSEGTHSESVSVRGREAQTSRTHSTVSAPRKGSSGKWAESGSRVSSSAAEQAAAMMPSGWWSQNVTVAYEQHIGRRVPGQDGNGEFQVSVSKTLDGTMDEALKRWIRLNEGREEFSDINISRSPTTTSTEKWRHWYCGLADGSRIAVNIYQKSPGKASLGLGHEKLESTEQVDHWRAYWKDQLAKL